MNKTEITYPKVSVLMPAYNAQAYIGEAIESILNQTFTDFELLCIDDCSTDSTWKILEEYAKKDARVLIYQNNENLRISKTRNKLLELARGTYIVWQDADDISLPYRIEKQYDFMESHREVGICGGYLEFFDTKGVQSVRRYATNDHDLRRTMFRFSPVAQPTAILRKDVLKKSGTFDENLAQAEDLDLSFRIGRHAQFANLSVVTLRYRLSDTSVTVSKLRENIACTLQVRKRAKKEYGYTMSLLDRITYVLTYGAQYLPTKLIYTVFNVMRNKKKD